MNASLLVSGRLAQIDAQIDKLEATLMRDEASFQREKMEAQEAFSARSRKLKAERSRLNALILERELLRAT